MHSPSAEGRYSRPQTRKEEMQKTPLSASWPQPPILRHSYPYLGDYSRRLSPQADSSRMLAVFSPESCLRTERGFPPGGMNGFVGRKHS